MTERVIALSGKAVEVASPGEVADVQVATTSTLGVVMVGDALECSHNGELSVCAAEPVDDLIFDQPEDYSSIAAALMSIRGQYNELLASLREAGLLKVRE